MFLLQVYNYLNLYILIVFMHMKENAWLMLIKVFGAPDGIRKMEFRLVQKWIKPQKGDKIIDIACGRGELSYCMANCGASVIGIDRAGAVRPLFELLNKNRGTQFVRATVKKMPFPANYFNKAVCNVTLQLFPNDKGALKEVARVLKRGGLLFLTVDSFMSPQITNKIKELHRKQNRVYRYYNHEKLMCLLSSLGFKTIKHEYYIKSGLSGYVFGLGIKSNWSVFWKVFSVFMYPFCYVAEKLSENERGYGLAVLARVV